MNPKKQLMDGLFYQNPVTVQLLGMCSTMAITTTLFNGIGMGVSVLMILTLSNILIAALRKIIPNNIRIACFIVVIAGFVTIVDLMLQAFIPALSSSLGLFIPLIVVNCIILGRAEAFSYKNTIAASTLDGIFQGLGYTIILVIMCVIREFLGAGTFMGGLLAIARTASWSSAWALPPASDPARGLPRPGHDPAGGRLPHPGLPHRRHAVHPEQAQEGAEKTEEVAK